MRGSGLNNITRSNITTAEKESSGLDTALWESENDEEDMGRQYDVEMC